VRASKDYVEAAWVACYQSDLEVVCELEVMSGVDDRREVVQN
jgi:hypothetical protein